MSNLVPDRDITRRSIMPVAVIAVTIMAILLRVLNLDRSFWMDEAYSQWFSALPLHTLWTDVPQYETHPPMYYTLLHGWRTFAGGGEVGLRLLSVIAGALTVLLVCLTGRILKLGAEGDWASLIAGLFLALNGGHIEMSQTARPYALQALTATIAILSMIVLLRSLRTRHPTQAGAARPILPIMALGLSGGATLWLHNTSFLIAFSLWCSSFLALLLFDRNAVLRSTLYLTVSGLLAIAIWSPFLPMFLVQNTGNATSSFWLTFEWSAVKNFVFTAAGGRWAVIPCGLLILAGFVRIFRWDRTVALALVLTLALPPAIAIAVSASGRPVFITRLFLWVTPALLLVAGVGLVWIFRKTKTRLVAVVLVSAFFVPAAITHMRLVIEDWKSILPSIAEQTQNGDVILALPNELATIFDSYPEQMALLPKVTLLPGPFPMRNPERTYIGNLGAPSIDVKDTAMIEAVIANARRVWLITRNEDLYDKSKIVRNIVVRMKPHETVLSKGVISISVYE